MKGEIKIDINPPPLAEVIEGVAQLERVGDIVPYAFFQQLRLPDQSGRATGRRTPFRLWSKALVLSYVLSWYLPKEVIIDGRKVHRKRFHGDSLRLVYSQLADLFGCSDDTIYRAVKDLVEVDQLITKERDEDGWVHVIPKVETIAALLAKPKAPMAEEAVPPRAERVPPAAVSSPPPAAGIPPGEEGLPLRAGAETAGSGTSQSSQDSPQIKEPTTTSAGQEKPEKSGGGSLNNEKEDELPDAQSGKPSGNQEPISKDLNNSGDGKALEYAEALVASWPKLMGRIMGRSISFPHQVVPEAERFFRSNPNWLSMDVLWVCFKGYLNASRNPGDTQHSFNCKRFATNPSSMFGVNKDNKFRLVRMAEELGYSLDFGEKEFMQAVNRELRSMGREPFKDSPPLTNQTTPLTSSKNTAPQPLSERKRYADEEVAELTKEYPVTMRRLGLDLSFNNMALKEAHDCFCLTRDCTHADVITVCVVAAVAALEHPAPDKGEDPYLYSSNFSLSPNEVFGVNGHNELRFLKIKKEIKYTSMALLNCKDRIDAEIEKVKTNGWFDLLRELRDWQQEQTAKRMRDPRRHDPVRRYECL